MRSNSLSRLARAAAVTAAVVFGSVGAQAATVNFTGWAYPSGSVVNTSFPGHTSVMAGGFTGSVSFAPGGESGFSETIQPFLSYCVEIDESFSGFPSGDMTGYSVIAGSSYDHWDGANGTSNTAADTAARLGQLLSYVSDNAGAVSTAAASTAMQLAIWNVIYDNDNTLLDGAFKSSSAAFTGIANDLLSNSAGWTNKFDVFVLTKVGKQDFVLVRDIPGRTDVPEPASLALVGLALAGLGLSRRRRAKA